MTDLDRPQTLTCVGGISQGKPSAQTCVFPLNHGGVREERDGLHDGESSSADSVDCANTGLASESVTRRHWISTILAGMASYLDAGSIVALGAGLAFLQRDLHLTRGDVGILVALGPNAIGCAVGALIGGWPSDKIGRKAIYQYDFILYAVGVLCVALAPGRELLLLGTLIMGVAVGADVPTSLPSLGELAPAKARGKLLGLTIVAWSL